MGGLVLEEMVIYVFGIACHARLWAGLPNPCPRPLRHVYMACAHACCRVFDIACHARLWAGLPNPCLSPLRHVYMACAHVCCRVLGIACHARLWAGLPNPYPSPLRHVCMACAHVCCRPRPLPCWPVQGSAATVGRTAHQGAAMRCATAGYNASAGRNSRLLLAHRHTHCMRTYVYTCTLSHTRRTRRTPHAPRMQTYGLSLPLSLLFWAEQRLGAERTRAGSDAVYTAEPGRRGRSAAGANLDSVRTGCGRVYGVASGLCLYSLITILRSILWLSV